MSNYINSYYLRGDYPTIYYNNEKSDKNAEHYYRYLVDELDNEKINFKNKNHKRAFLNHKARTLNFEYQYNFFLREKGKQAKIIAASPIYIECVKLAHSTIKRKIYDKEIYVEANPTSNKKISSVNKYIDLPFLQLNQFLLTKNSDNEATKYPIPITINTDDSSIFQTNLHNEYSLVAAALLKENFNKEEVYRYIEYLRASSIEQNFI